MAEQAAVENIKINDIVSFYCYGVGIVNGVVDGRVVSISSGLGLQNPVEAAVNHANIYSSLPTVPYNPIPDDYTKYNYFLIKLSNNELIEIGIPWINPTSLTRLLRGKIIVSINDFDVSQLPSLKELLTTNGYLNITITV
jgi:hypothetical protein